LAFFAWKSIIGPTTLARIRFHHGTPTHPASLPGRRVAATPRALSDRSYQRLATQLLALIAQGEFKLGERLPSERALAERFDVSRTSVREAMIALELQGVVEVRGGSGIYVTQVRGNAAASPFHVGNRPRSF
jgi:GntR family uxuAB operon transcriptional repressor